ncbi:MAG: MmcQ/YjbR family DNA-binding protein [Actinomycetota bacterium]
MDIAPLYDDAASMTDRALEHLRTICLSLPEATERLSHGEPTWFVRGKKPFVTYAGHHHDDRLAFWCAAPEGVQAEMVAGEPERFFVPPYVGVRGWLGVRLDVSTDWDEITEIVREAYRHVAPVKLVAQMDGAS